MLGQQSATKLHPSPALLIKLQLLLFVFLTLGRKYISHKSSVSKYRILSKLVHVFISMCIPFLRFPQLFECMKHWLHKQGLPQRSVTSYHSFNSNSFHFVF